MIRKAIAVWSLLLGFACLAGSADLTGNIEFETSTGYLHSAGQRFQLYGIHVIDRDRECIANELIWACGKAAHQALLNHIDKESLVCILLPAGDSLQPDPPMAECFLGARSVNAQLVADGWALTAVDSPAPYWKEALAAQLNGKGIFRGDFEPPDEWRPNSGIRLEDCSICTARHQSLIRAREKRKAQLESESENN